jgi:hypothetical protein
LVKEIKLSFVGISNGVQDTDRYDDIDRCNKGPRDGPIFTTIGFHNKITFYKQRVNALYLTKVGYDQASGRSYRNREDFDSISKRPQNHKPELIHTILCSKAGIRRARSRGSQRDLFTSPRRIRKNKGVQGTQQLGCKKTICCCLFSIIKT